MLKASSFLYALFVCLIVSLICGSLLLIFSYQFRLKQFYFLQEDLIAAADANFVHLLQQMGSESIATSGNLSTIDERMGSSYKISQWGCYPLVKTQTIFKNDTLHKAALVGGTNTASNLALYMTERDKSLNIGGESQIVGDVRVSKRGVSPAYVGNHNFVKKELVKGSVGVSDRKLPELKEIGEINNWGEVTEMTMEEASKRPIYNSFRDELIVVAVEDAFLIENISLSGNIILQSKDSIVIGANARLNDILIKAPSVTFLSGFKGTVQVFAERHVFLQENTELHYPSSIYLKNNSVERSSVFLDKKSKVAGGIIATGQGYESSINKMVTIDEDAVLIGDLYCHGKTQLKGTVVGTVYTNLFHLRTASSVYENYIVGGVINRLDLPKSFVGLPLFDNEKTNYTVVKEL